jgi:DNA-3-methyladenine glycosylase
MRASRPVDEDIELTNGPGKLTIALDVDRSLNGFPVDDETHPVHVLDNRLDFEVGRSNRIGVTKDLSEKLRFYVKGSRFVSRR